MTLPAMVTVHDVMPSTLDRVERILGLLDRPGARGGPVPATLLVVAGRGWSAREVERLAAWSSAGYRLAGHGWTHRAPAVRSVGHRLHAALLSRDCAEHLSRTGGEVRELVRSSYRWFGRAGLEPPELYVPPAWALGPLDAGDLRELPFRWYETLSGFVHGPSGTRRVLPLVGFEADTPARAAALRTLNAVNLAVARASGRAVRIALHPDDLDLRLRDRVREILAHPWRWVEGPALSRATAGRIIEMRSVGTVPSGTSEAR